MSNLQADQLHEQFGPKIYDFLLYLVGDESFSYLGFHEGEFLIVCPCSNHDGLLLAQDKHSQPEILISHEARTEIPHLQVIGGILTKTSTLPALASLRRIVVPSASLRIGLEYPESAILAHCLTERSDRNIFDPLQFILHPNQEALLRSLMFGLVDAAILGNPPAFTDVSDVNMSHFLYSRKSHHLICRSNDERQRAFRASVVGFEQLPPYEAIHRSKELRKLLSGIKVAVENYFDLYAFARFAFVRSRLMKFMRGHDWAALDDRERFAALAPIFTRLDISIVSISEAQSADYLWTNSLRSLLVPEFSEPLTPRLWSPSVPVRLITRAKENTPIGSSLLNLARGLRGEVAATLHSPLAANKAWSRVVSSPKSAFIWSSVRELFDESDTKDDGDVDLHDETHAPESREGIDDDPSD